MLLQKPTPNELPILVAPVAEHMQAATAMTEGRRSTVFNHQKVVAESLHALSWMVYTGPNCGRSSRTHALKAFVRPCFKPLSPGATFSVVLGALNRAACSQIHRSQTDHQNF